MECRSPENNDHCDNLVPTSNGSVTDTMTQDKSAAQERSSSPPPAPAPSIPTITTTTTANIDINLESGHIDSGNNSLFNSLYLLVSDDNKVFVDHMT